MFLVRRVSSLSFVPLPHIHLPVLFLPRFGVEPEDCRGYLFPPLPVKVVLGQTVADAVPAYHEDVEADYHYGEWKTRNPSQCDVHVPLDDVQRLKLGINLAPVAKKLQISYHGAAVTVPAPEFLPNPDAAPKRPSTGSSDGAKPCGCACGHDHDESKDKESCAEEASEGGSGSGVDAPASSSSDLKLTPAVVRRGPVSLNDVKKAKEQTRSGGITMKIAVDADKEGSQTVQTDTRPHSSYKWEHLPGAEAGYSVQVKWNTPPRTEGAEEPVYEDGQVPTRVRLLFSVPMPSPKALASEDKDEKSLRTRLHVGEEAWPFPGEVTALSAVMSAQLDENLVINSEVHQLAHEGDNDDDSAKRRIFSE